MLAAFDPVEPARPAAPLLNGYRTAQNVVLSWPEPDGNGLPVTGYNVYRKINNGAETQIASGTTQRQLVDVADPSKTYAYRVTAINSQGESVSSNVFAPLLGQNAPQPQLSCSLPGQVFVDRTGEGGSEPNNDIATFSIAEPSSMPGKLVFVINNAQPNLVQNGNSLFYVYFDPPSGGIRYRLRYSADPSNSVNEIATGRDNDFTNDPTPETGGEFRNWTVVSQLEPGSGIQPDGSVRFIVDKAKLNIKDGDVLLGVAVREDTAHSPSGVIAADYAGGRQDYTVVGNNFCSAVPVPVSVVSRKTHNGTDIDLNLPLTGKRGVECRTGDTKLVFTFPVPITNCGTATQGTATTGPNAYQCVVNVSGLANAEYYQIGLNGIVSSTGATGNVPGPQWGLLIGDVDATGRVDGNDVSAVQSHTRQSADDTTFRYDINLTGRIDGNDVSATQSQTRTGLPSSP